jgi:hypothetical protein
MKFEEKAVASLAGGIMQHGYQCGMIWGATLAAGAQSYRLLGPGPQAEAAAITAAERLVESFRALNNTINCLEITGLDRSSSKLEMIKFFLAKGGSVGCFRRATRYAGEAFREIHDTFSERHEEPPSHPVSCAAMLARKMNQSDMHTVMAAGLAGGIGLCGGACGALGAAVWIIVMNSMKEGTGKFDYRNSAALDVIERFLKCTDYKFECSDIVGRTFENIDDHAGYVRSGGCSNIIEVLAAK